MQYKFRYREVYKGVHIDCKANTKKELQEKVEKKKKDIDKGYSLKDITLKDYAFKWAELYKEPKVSSAWYEEILRTLNRLVDHIGNKPMKHITVVEVQEFINSYQTKSDSYAKKTYDIVNQLFNRAYKDRYIPYPLELERVKGKSAKNGRRITDKERAVLLKVLDGHRGELFCKFMLYCGLRGGEVAALQWKDVDLINGYVEVNKAIKKDDSLGAPKSTSGFRKVPIPYNFMKELENCKRSPFEYICPMTNGKPHTQTARKKMWNNIKRLMNIEMGCKVFRNELIPPYPLDDDFKIHYLRHTYCTDLEQAGVPINVAKVLMGHSSIEVTSKIYTHTTDNTLEQARMLINMGNHVGNFEENV